VFNQFHRADKSRSRKEHFGLGLSIAQKLAAAQQASVWVDDTPGGGATFVLKLKEV
jgi:signal transduction histidine kinase